MCRLNHIVWPAALMSMRKRHGSNRTNGTPKAIEFEVADIAEVSIEGTSAVRLRLFDRDSREWIVKLPLEALDVCLRRVSGEDELVCVRRPQGITPVLAIHSVHGSSSETRPAANRHFRAELPTAVASKLASILTQSQLRRRWR